MVLFFKKLISWNINCLLLDWGFQSGFFPVLLQIRELHQFFFGRHHLFVFMIFLDRKIMTIIFHVSSLKYVFPLENYDKVINFSLYVNKVEIDKILRKFTGRKLHLCIIHTKPNYIKSFVEVSGKIWRESMNELLRKGHAWGAVARRVVFGCLYMKMFCVFVT